MILGDPGPKEGVCIYRMWDASQALGPLSVWLRRLPPASMVLGPTGSELGSWELQCCLQCWVLTQNLPEPSWHPSCGNQHCQPPGALPAAPPALLPPPLRSPQACSPLSTPPTFWKLPCRQMPSAPHQAEPAGSCAKPAGSWAFPLGGLSAPAATLGTWPRPQRPPCSHLSPLCPPPLVPWEASRRWGAWAPDEYTEGRRGAAQLLWGGHRVPLELRPPDTDSAPGSEAPRTTQTLPWIPSLQEPGRQTLPWSGGSWNYIDPFLAS